MTVSSPYKPGMSTVEILEAFLANSTPEERAALTEQLRQAGRLYADYLGFERNAENAWNEWLARKRPTSSVNDDLT
jgi:hypothetical protein